nr:type II toxin-antitoxin system ParD family antitoxin [Burkholderia alba]
MISAYLGNQLECYVAHLVETGRYGSKSEVLREGVRLILERDAQFSALDVVPHHSLSDSHAGHSDSAETSAVRVDQPKAGDTK